MGHSEETKRKIGIANTGKLKGRKRNPESVKKGALKRRKGKFFNCLKCNTVFWRRPSSIKKGQCKFCSKKCYQIYQKGISKNTGFKLRPLTGELNKNWKGGITPESIKIRNSKQYKGWRLSVFKRDDFTCQECYARCGNGKNVYLEAHHIKPFATHKNLRFDLTNGITLCKKCHSFKPKGIKIYG